MTDTSRESRTRFVDVFFMTQESQTGRVGTGQRVAHRKEIRTQKNNPKTTQKQPKTSLNTYTNTYTNTNNKKQYGECANVLLTDEEHQKIIDEGYAGLIEELSLYIASKGDKYKSHYAVIKQWANRRKKEQAEKTVSKPNQFTQGVMRTEIDFSDLEKRLVKN